MTLLLTLLFGLFFVGGTVFSHYVTGYIYTYTLVSLHLTVSNRNRSRPD